MTSQLKALQIEIRVPPLFQLLRTVRDSGKKAFVRLQVVRALELYQVQVVSVAVPDLTPIRTKLANSIRVGTLLFGIGHIQTFEMPRTKRIYPACEVFHVLNRAAARLTMFVKAEEYAATMRVVEGTWEIVHCRFMRRWQCPTICAL